MDFSPIRGPFIVVCHREPVIRLGLGITLERSIHRESVRSVPPADHSPAEILDMASVAVTDYDHGLRLCDERRNRMRRSSGAHAEIMVVSDRGGEREIRSAIAAGVKGYLLSGFRLEEFVDGISSVGSGSRYLCAAAANRLVDSLSREELTVRETQVLRCLMRGYVNKQICDELGIALGTVKSHVNAIFSKFGVSTRTQVVSMATQLGLLPGERSDARPLTHPGTGRIPPMRSFSGFKGNYATSHVDYPGDPGVQADS